MIVRIWGRAGEAVKLFADGTVVARGRIGRVGWVEVAPRGIRPGTRLHATGRAGHHSHVITASRGT